MHTRGSHESSPLLFDPEIERTLRKNRVLIRRNKVIDSPTSPFTPRNIMQDPHIPTTGQTTSPFMPTSSHISPNTTLPNFSTSPETPSHTTQPSSTQIDPNLTFNPSNTIPPFSYFFPTTGQSSSTIPQPQGQGSTIVHTTSTYQPPNQSDFYYSSFQGGQNSRFQRDVYDDEEFMGI